MHVVVRRFGASQPATAVATNIRQPALTELQRSHGYYAPTPGDVQVLTPARTTVQPRTTPTTSTPQPTGTPEVTDACNKMWVALLGQAPVYVHGCINNTAHKRVFDQICQNIAAGKTTAQAGAAQWAGYVDQQCPPPRQTPPSTPSTPPQSTTPPTSTPATPTAPPYRPTVTVPSGDSVADQPESAPDSGYLRQLGGLVGIGFFFAVGLTYARKRGMLKLTKRRHRR